MSGGASQEPIHLTCLDLTMNGGEIFEVVVACIICTLVFWAPFVSGLLCNLSERRMLRRILYDNDILETRLSGKLFWYFHWRRKLLWFCTYMPWIGLPFQFYEVYQQARFGTLCARNGITMENRTDVMNAVWPNMT